MQRDQIRTGTNILLIRHEEIWQRETPFCWSQSKEEVRESNLPYCPAAHSAHIVIQVGIPFLVET